MDRISRESSKALVAGRRGTARGGGAEIGTIWTEADRC